MMRLLPVLCLFLAGCGGPGAKPTDAARGIRLEPDAAGLAVSGPGVTGAGRIDFGRAPAGVIPLLEREVGPGRDLGLDGCPAGVRRQVAWGDLVLTFTDERFVGWRGPRGEAGQVCGAMA